VSASTMHAIWWASPGGSVVQGPYYTQIDAWESLRLDKGGESYPFPPGARVWCSRRNERAEFAEHAKKKGRRP